MNDRAGDALLLVTTSYPQEGDGSEAAGGFVADLAQELARHRPVRVVAPGLRASSPDRRVPLPVWRYAAGDRPLSLLSPADPRHWPAIVRTLRSLQAQALAAAADGGVAHTLALWVLPSGWAARCVQRRHGTPYSTWALGSDIWTLGRLPVARAALKRIMRGAARRYADGLQLAEDAARIARMPVEFLPSTRRIDARRQNAARDRPPYRLLFLGRWHRNKGIDLLLDALALLDDDDWQRIDGVDIYGGGPLEALVRERVTALQAAKRPLRLYGYIDKPGAEQALLRADWLLLPSRIESIPVVFSDAMKLGTPVVATPVGDLPVLVSRHQCGICAGTASAAGFAAALGDALRAGPAAFAAGTASAAQAFDLAGIALRLVGRMGAPVAP